MLQDTVLGQHGTPHSQWPVVGCIYPGWRTPVVPRNWRKTWCWTWITSPQAVDRASLMGVDHQKCGREILLEMCGMGWWQSTMAIIYFWPWHSCINWLCCHLLDACYTKPPGDEKSGQDRIDRTSIFKPMVIQTKDRKRPIVAVAFRCETVVPPPALRGKEQYVVNWWPGAHSKAGGCWGMVKQTGALFMSCEGCHVAWKVPNLWTKLALVEVLQKTILAASRSSRLCSEQAVHRYKILKIVYSYFEAQ